MILISSSSSSYALFNVDTTKDFFCILNHIVTKNINSVHCVLVILCLRWERNFEDIEKRKFCNLQTSVVIDWHCTSKRYLCFRIVLRDFGRTLFCWTKFTWNCSSSFENTVDYGQCYYPSMRTENKGLLVLFSVHQGRCIDDNFKSEIIGTGSPSNMSSTV